MAEYEIQPQSGRGRVVKYIWSSLPSLLLLATIVVIIGLFMVIGEKKERLEEERAKALARERPAVNVILMEMHPALIRDRINLPGIIEPWEDLELLSKINGSIVDVSVAEGDRVAEGDVIARIDPADYVIALDSARAAYDLATADLKRARTLFDKGLIPKADLDRITTRMHTTKAAKENAELMLSRCTVKAPVSGVIRRLDAKVGLLLTVADPIARILQVDTVKAVVGIPESDVSMVQVINEVELSLQALDNRKITGRKHQLAVSPDNTARLYNLELAIDNRDNTIRPGMFVRAEIVKESVEQALSVPLYSVLSRNGDKYVFVEEKGVARRREVKLGITEEWRVQVTEGLKQGDRVLVEGHRNVEDGQKINIARVLTGFEGLSL
jgi:membrane fusion protein (multidrug efflux system)